MMPWEFIARVEEVVNRDAPAQEKVDAVKLLCSQVRLQYAPVAEVRQAQQPQLRPAVPEEAYSNLLPCPFCGSNEVSSSLGTKGDGTPWPYIECHNCAGCAEPAWWNHRASAQEPQGEAQQPDFTDTSRAALLWVLWHHQGGSSPVGQPIRFALGMGQHDRLTDSQIAEAKRWASHHPSAMAQPESRKPLPEHAQA